MLYYEINESEIEEKIKNVSELYSTLVDNIKYKVIYTDEKSKIVGLEIYENLLPKSVESEEHIPDKKIEEEFKIEIERDGIFLTVLKSGVEFNRISEVILEKDIVNCEYSKIEEAVNSIGHKIKISESEERLFIKPSIEIKTENNDMRGFIKISKHGNFDMLKKSDLYEAIEKRGIRFGVDDLELDLILKQKITDKFVKIAEGIDKINGEDAEIIMNVEIITADMGFRAKEDEKGQIDFKSLELFTMVNKGDIIATKIPATEGKEGKDILGNGIIPNAGKDKLLRTGKNTTTSEDGLKIISEIDGMIVKEQDKISVMDVYKVSNVGVNTGNIDFNGSVIITGDILSGYSVTAAGNIEVNGNLEDCYLKAGGNIVIKGGIAGRLAGKIESMGDVVAKFAESVEIFAGGDVTVNEEIISCKIFCGGVLRTLSKKGHIIGGEIVAAKGVESVNIGSVYGVKTFIEVGNNPLLVKIIDEKSREISDLKIKLENVEKNVIYLENKKDVNNGKLSEADEEKMETLRKAKFSMSYYVAEAEVSLETFKREEEIAINAEIKCSGLCCQGVEIKIKDRKYKVKDEMKNPTFYYDENEIKYKYV